MTTVKQLNIHAVYSQASQEELRAGLVWYSEANEEADRLAEENGITLRQAAAVIAAVSPGLRWDVNIECAERIIRAEPLDGLGVRWFDGVRKARRILRGHNPDVVLRGNKVKSFFACIVNPDNRTTVCVDGHAYAIWVGRRIPLDDVPPMNNRLYNRIASDYVVVANALNMSPGQLQAICWLTWRRIHEV